MGDEVDLEVNLRLKNLCEFLQYRITECLIRHDELAGPAVLLKIQKYLLILLRAEKQLCPHPITSGGVDKVSIPTTIEVLSFDYEPKWKLTHPNPGLRNRTRLQR